MNFTSKRISKTRNIRLNAPLETIFPLFGPIKEKEWAFGWEPQMLHSTDNLVNEHMIFKTTANHRHEADYMWIVSKYLPESALIEYTVFTPERLWWITIQCSTGRESQTTEAEITYTFSGLSEQGNLINEKALEFMYRHDLKDWEDAINYYLATGKCKEHGL